MEHAIFLEEIIWLSYNKYRQIQICLAALYIKYTSNSELCCWFSISFYVATKSAKYLNWNVLTEKYTMQYHFEIRILDKNIKLQINVEEVINCINDCAFKSVTSLSPLISQRNARYQLFVQIQNTPTNYKLFTAFCFESCIIAHTIFYGYVLFISYFVKLLQEDLFPRILLYI